MSFGKKIRQLRRKKGISQEKLAKIIGISRSTLSMYELEEREPDILNIIKFADFFGVSTDYLLCRKTKPSFDLQHSPEELKELIRLVIKEVQEEYEGKKD